MEITLLSAADTFATEEVNCSTLHTEKICAGNVAKGNVLKDPKSRKRHSVPVEMRTNV